MLSAVAVQALKIFLVENQIEAIGVDGKAVLSAGELQDFVTVQDQSGKIFGGVALLEFWKIGKDRKELLPVFTRQIRNSDGSLLLRRGRLGR